MMKFLVQRSSAYGYYGGPPYKRQRRLSDEDIGPPPVNFVPAYYDPPYVRHQVGHIYVISNWFFNTLHVIVQHQYYANWKGFSVYEKNTIIL